MSNSHITFAQRSCAAEMKSHRQGNEEELKNRIAEEFFPDYDCAHRLGKIDFCVAVRQHTPQDELRSLLWAEAKTGERSDLYASLVQLILTIGREQTHQRHLPPPYLAALDAAQIAFIPFSTIMPFLSMNDFNWTVAPSDRTSKEFGMLHNASRDALKQDSLLFRYDADEDALRDFISTSLLGGEVPRVEITKNSFVHVFHRWMKQVQPSVGVNWISVKKAGIIEADFYLADLLSSENQTLREKLYVVLQHDRYRLNRRIEANGLFTESSVGFTDGQKAHAAFWDRYARPPRQEYWEHIITRRDLLVPSDMRERKGSFFTPSQWVELSQQHLANALGESWQTEYYVWDCAAGTGNLLEGLTEKYRLFASTIDKADVDVMHQRTASGSLNLLPEHVFQFDFLNDEFSGKLPPDLLRIIHDPEARRRLVIYINPPYAEVGKMRSLASGIEGSRGVQASRINQRYKIELGQASRELFAQFLLRIDTELRGCVMGVFCTLKGLAGQHFFDFRTHFQPRLVSLAVLPSWTFDNVQGKFPIGFHIWDGKERVPFRECKAEVYDAQGARVGTKWIRAHASGRSINDWAKQFRAPKDSPGLVGKIPISGADFQHNPMVALVNPTAAYLVSSGQLHIDIRCVMVAAVFFAVRHAIKRTWLNDRDQFLWPQAQWQEDKSFQADCMAYMLFHPQNRIRSSLGVNHWIPFTEEEVGAHGLFESHFITDYMAGRLGKRTADLFGQSGVPSEPMHFSPEGDALFDAGCALWQYYHAQPNATIDASLYDIREHFQGRNARGIMNATSYDEEYHRLLANLKRAVETLRLRIEPKVYEYQFLI